MYNLAFLTYEQYEHAVMTQLKPLLHDSSYNQNK